MSGVGRMSGIGWMSEMREELGGLLTGQEMWVTEEWYMASCMALEIGVKGEVGRRGTVEECLHVVVG